MTYKSIASETPNKTNTGFFLIPKKEQQKTILKIKIENPIVIRIIATIQLPH